jgi:hypothetical protein
LANLEISNATERYYLPWQEDDSTAHGGLANSRRVQTIVGKIVSGVAPPSTEHPYTFVRPADRLDPEPGVDLTLHSAAHLQVSSGTLRLGGTDGTITETLPGTFLRLNGVEYAALPDVTGRTYDVRITGIADGSFDLSVRRVTARGTTSIEFPSVAVVDGTEATVAVDPRTLSRTPAMEVRSNGVTTRVAPVVVATGAEPDGDGSRSGAIAVLGGVLAALAAAGLAVWSLRRRRIRSATVTDDR